MEGREEGLNKQNQTVQSVAGNPALTNKRSSSVSWQWFSNNVIYSFCAVLRIKDYASCVCMRCLRSF